MLFLKQSTAVNVLVGPFVDESDGKTAETGLTISQADIRVSKNGGNMAQKNEASAATHDELGYYSCPLDATDTGTLGRLKLMVHESGALPVWHDFMVLPANIYDSWVAGTDKQEVDATQVEGGDATDQIRDAVVDDATRVDASALNALSGKAPDNTIADVDDIAGLNDLSANDVNAQVVDALATDTLSELTQGIPPASPTHRQAIMALYMALRNKLTVDADYKTVHNDAGTAVFKKALSDDGMTYTEGEAQSGA